jgi:hypothetical protein
VNPEEQMKAMMMMNANAVAGANSNPYAVAGKTNNNMMMKSGGAPSRNQQTMGDTSQSLGANGAGNSKIAGGVGTTMMMKRRRYQSTDKYVSGVQSNAGMAGPITSRAG